MNNKSSKTKSLRRKLDKATSDAIVEMLGKGFSTAEICRALGVSRNAVSYRENARVESNVADRRPECGATIRCPECGAIIRSPKCLACWLRRPSDKRGWYDARDFAVPVADERD